MKKKISENERKGVRKGRKRCQKRKKKMPEKEGKDARKGRKRCQEKKEKMSEKEGENMSGKEGKYVRK